MIDLEKDQLDTVRQILETHVPQCAVRVFGSRAKGTSTRYSDLDLALVCSAKIDWQQLESLKSAFSESDLPICIDIVDWHAVSDSFQRCIAEHYEVLIGGGK